MLFNLNNLIKKGFFPKEIPPVFNTDKFADNINQYKGTIKSINKNYKGSCTKLSVYKDETHRRIFRIPNIELYSRLCIELVDKKELIFNQINKSNFSQSKKIKSLKEDEYKTDWFLNFKERINKSFGYKYCLKTDISNFYDSIYTHAIVWAGIGKEETKKQRKLGCKSEKHKMYDKLDKKVRKLIKNETYGIPIGPVTSHIISEIILSRIDIILDEKGYTGTRYRDDYKLYFKNKSDAQKAIYIIQSILQKYKLNINSKKTEIKLYPYEISNNLRDELNKSKLNNTESYVNYLEKANLLYDKGVESSYKYALKVLKDVDIPRDNFFVIQSMLLNILLIRPDLSILIFEILDNNSGKVIASNDIEKMINELINDNLELSNNQEVLWLVYFLIKFNLKVENKNIIEILKKGDDFSRILVLDYIFNANCQDDIDGDLKEGIKLLFKSLEDDHIHNENWLLIYEIVYNDFSKDFNVDLRKIIEEKDNSIFSRLIDDNINFYKSILK